MNIGNEIKRLRIKNGLTQEELADRCELSKGFISQIERDLASPSISTLSDILQCLGTDLKNFFNSAVDEEVVFKATKDDGTGYPEYYYRKIGTIHYDGENVTYTAVPFKGSEVPKNKFAYFIH